MSTQIAYKDVYLNLYLWFIFLREGPFSQFGSSEMWTAREFTEEG